MCVFVQIRRVGFNRLSLGGESRSVRRVSLVTITMEMVKLLRKGPCAFLARINTEREDNIAGEPSKSFTCAQIFYVVRRSDRFSS